MLLYFLLCIRKEICGDQFSLLIMRVRVLHAPGTSDGYVQGFGGKKLFLLLGGNISFYQFHGSPSPFSNFWAVKRASL